jgi:hypothetical protein
MFGVGAERIAQEGRGVSIRSGLEAAKSRIGRKGELPTAVRPGLRYRQFLDTAGSTNRGRNFVRKPVQTLTGIERVNRAEVRLCAVEDRGRTHYWVSNRSSAQILARN